MYLDYLNDEEKNIFLDLGIMLAAADAEFDDKEKKALDLLCDEMKIIPRYSAKKSIEECIAYINANSSKRNKKIILFELTGIAYADQNFAKEESDLIKNVVEAIGLTKEDNTYIVEAVAKLYKEYSTIISFLNN